MKAWTKKITFGVLLSGLCVLPLAALIGPSLAQQEKGGAQLWAENCGRCHYLRSPKERSDRQWEIITLHMRVRANLTAQDATKIVEFLKDSN